jgi:hypothetical protein
MTADKATLRATIRLRPPFQAESGARREVVFLSI